ncbi:hypothetical protein MVEN_01884300 [Mycena venus]|uniref:Uncharacterized protein n=1 Tax=Mycena venus TaxID=2733690 RepID=A0A8H7CKZ5_9AGAR|nr:hypothetical protein MVEN_01884300 [Mycena venus]
MPCTGKSGKGCSASCSKFHPKRLDDNKCKECGHRKKAHKPGSAVSDILAKYDLERITSKATDLQARKETNSGFRPKKEKSEKDKEGKSATTIRIVKLGSVSIITAGLDSHGTLQKTRCPTPSVFESLLSSGLAVLKTREGGVLTFKKDWDQARIDKWFCTLFPYVFEFLDARYPEDAAPGYHWVLTNKDGRALFVMRRPIDGDLLDQVKGSSSKKLTEHAIRIATKHKIPASVYATGFEDAIESMMGGTTFASESESEDEAPRQWSRKKKIKPVAAEDSEEDWAEDFKSDDGEGDDLQLQDQLGDAAGLDEDFPEHPFGEVKVKLEKNDSKSYIITIDDSDDDAESDKQVAPWPSKWEDSNSRQSSSKRSLSPGADEAGTKHKRTRRESRSPVATFSDEETESLDRSPSPPLDLQPASSFQYSFDPSLHLSSGAGAATITTAPIPASVVPVTTTTAIASTASSSSSTSSGSSRYIPFSANVRRYSPPSPKEGLYVPKAKYNPWDW